MSRDMHLAAASATARVNAMADLIDSPMPPTVEELAALLDCLADERKLVQRRAAESFAILSRRGLPVEDMLSTALGAQGWRLRWGAAFALSLIGEVPAKALDTLVEILGFADGDLRWAATDVLSQLAVQDRGAVVRRLVEVADDGNAEQRKMALYCLRDLKASERAAIAAADRALEAGPIDVRLAGLSALAQLATDVTAASRRIASLIEDPDVRMGRAAAGTLGSLDGCSAEAVAALHRAQANPDPSIRRAARRSLGLLEDRTN